jgi:hypothetical protein
LTVIRHAALSLTLLAALCAPLPARAQEGGVEEIKLIIRDRAQAHGVSPDYMLAVAWCESRYDHHAVGDGGRSRGLFQLRSPGEADRFFAQGYDDIWDPWEQSDFTARRFAVGGARAWSCS